MHYLVQAELLVVVVFLGTRTGQHHRTFITPQQSQCETAVQQATDESHGQQNMRWQNVFSCSSLPRSNHCTMVALQSVMVLVPLTAQPPKKTLGGLLMLIFLFCFSVKRRQKTRCGVRVKPFRIYYYCTVRPRACRTLSLLGDFSVVYLTTQRMECQLIGCRALSISRWRCLPVLKKSN